MGDLFAIELEIETIGRFIQPGQHVLDVGCGNGFSTFRQLDPHPGAIFTGVDNVRFASNPPATLRYNQ